MKLISLILVFLLTSCAHSPPQNASDLCGIFEDRRSWYKAAIESQRRWDVPLHVSMAFIKQESAYVAKARPPRNKVLWFFPGRRVSSAYGYAQVLDTTWAEYKKATGRRGASRSNFADSVDFIGWYNKESLLTNNIALNDAYNLYLAYHEGNGGFSQKSYLKKPGLIDIARKVQKNSEAYQIQYQQCSAKLGRNWLQRVLF